MQDNEFVLVRDNVSSVVVTPQEQVVTSVVQEVAVVNIDTESVVTNEVTTIQVVAVSPAVGTGGSGGTGGAVFALDVTATATGIVGSKTYDASTVPANTVLASCTSDTKQVRIHVGADGGDTYSPQVTINGITATLTESATKRWFTGYADITLPADGDNTVTITSSAGGSDTIVVTAAGAGPNVLTCTFGAYPGAQTELKAGDTITATVTTESAATSVIVQNGGASNNSVEFPVTAGSATISVTIGAGSGAIPVYLKAKNTLGTLGAEFTTSNLTLNQTYPTIGAFTVSYPASKQALDTGDTANVASTVTNYTTVTYTSTDVSIPSPTTYNVMKTVTQAATGYVGSGTNYTISANRAANNATTSASTLVKIATVAPTAAITIVPTGRLVSSPTGITYDVRITPNQVLGSAPSLTASHGAWSGSWTLSGSYWHRSLVVSDAVVRGTGTFTGLSVTGLSGLVGSTITSGATYTVGGFSSRNITFPAFSRVAPLGVNVADQTKVTAQISGGAVLTRHTDNGVYANGYYIADSDGSYNPNGAYLGLSDSVFAGSNTSGTLQAIVQEVA